jgi:tetratricopeptide (TPR) repeat protein
MTDDDRGGTLEMVLQEDGDGPDSLLAALSRARSELDRERAAAPSLVAELLAIPPAAREEELCRDPRFHTWGLCELLLRRSLEAPEPAAADELALLALAGTERLDPVRHPAPVVGDLKARIWAAAGEARRRQGDLAGAEEALRAAATSLAQGTGDLLVEARLLEFEAAVRRTQGRTREAAALLKQAAARYRQIGETQHLERVLADRETVLREGGHVLPPRSQRSG